MTRTVAAVDCGTNSIRLLVVRQEPDGSLTELAREVRLARLGQGVDATRRFHPDALARAFVVCEEFDGIIQRLDARDVRFVATSAARDVVNRDEFFDGVRQRMGVDPEVISGDEEAALSAAGVLSGVTAETPALVIDIGGGSTELVVIEAGNEVTSARSLDVGAVRVRERHLHGDPPTDDEIAAARGFIGSLLDGSGVDFGQVRTAVGVAGTVTSVAARVLRLQQYSREAVHGAVLARGDITEATHHWTGTPVALIEQEPCMHPLRAGVIAGGALILDEISSRVPSGAVLVSETDILDGIAMGILAGGSRSRP